ncbi:MAG: DUF1318 domain-containing protein [Chthoniobacterales bacterium]
MAARKTRQRISAALAACALLAGCKAPSINLATSEPIKVDIAMRLDVYQHTSGNGTTTASSPAATVAPAKPAPTPARGGDPEERRKNRQADIQTFKNSRIIGEGHNGLLTILVEPAGDYGDYVRRTVAGENSDRMAIMKARAEKEKRSLPDVQVEQAKLWVDRSFKGEWIETQKPDGSYQWVQKAG